MDHSRKPQKMIELLEGPKPKRVGQNLNIILIFPKCKSFI